MDRPPEDYLTSISLTIPLESNNASKIAIDFPSFVDYCLKFNMKSAQTGLDNDPRQQILV